MIKRLLLAVLLGSVSIAHAAQVTVPVTPCTGSSCLNVPSGNTNGPAADTGASPVTPSNSGDIIVNPTSSFTRPANTTAYASGQLIANSTTAASVVPLTWTAGRVTAGSATGPSNFYIRKARMQSSGKNLTNAFFNLYVYSSSPTIVNGDGAAWSTTLASLVCVMPINLTSVGTDVAVGAGLPAIGSDCNVALASGQALYGLLVANSPYTPISGETEAVTLEIHQN